MNKSIAAIALSLAALGASSLASAAETATDGHKATAMSVARQGNLALQEVSLDAALNLRIDARGNQELRLALRRHDITGSMTAALNP